MSLEAVGDVLAAAAWVPHRSDVLSHGTNNKKRVLRKQAYARMKRTSTYIHTYIQNIRASHLQVFNDLQISSLVFVQEAEARRFNQLHEGERDSC